MTSESDFFAALQRGAERYLTRRRKRHLSKKMKQQAKNPVLDWIEAILWAACVVLVVNQYLFQAYRIPSGSMEDTLLIKDMIFVDKFSYGPELLPGVAKLPGLAAPKRGQIVVFENPTYLSKGPAYTILQQMLYMLTLTLVDIDRDENGQPRVHYLIKRAVGMPGDRLRIEGGEAVYRFQGDAAWTPERDYKASIEAGHKLTRMVEAAEYEGISGAGRAAAYREAGLEPPEALASAAPESAYKDAYAADAARVGAIRDMYPQDHRFAAQDRRYRGGWYIPEGRLLPMGDNRDNSRDGRYFGPVAQKKVLGKALFKYWPPRRVGAVR